MRQRRHKEAKLLVAFLDAINVNSRFAERYFERCGLCSSFSLHRVQLSGISVNADFGKAGWKRWGTSLLAFHNPSRVTEDSLSRGGGPTSRPGGATSLSSPSPRGVAFGRRKRCGATLVARTYLFSNKGGAPSFQFETRNLLRSHSYVGASSASHFALPSPSFEITHEQPLCQALFHFGLELSLHTHTKR